MISSQLPSIKDSDITDALVNLVGSCAYALLHNVDGIMQGTVISNDIETALAVQMALW